MKCRDPVDQVSARIPLIARCEWDPSSCIMLARLIHFCYFRGRCGPSRSVGQNLSRERMNVLDPYHITQPMTAAPATTQAELTRNRSRATKLRANTMSVALFTIDALANCIVTTAINARETATTPSSAAAAIADRRRRVRNGPLNATKTKPGRKIPTVATIAPRHPATTYPMKVAVADSGPGVN